MDLSKVLPILIAATLAYRTGAFLPSHVGVTLPATDYTLTDITVHGIVRAVARYFEDTNPDRYSPGDLTNLSPLTPSRLFQKHYGGESGVAFCKYGSKFSRKTIKVCGNWYYRRSSIIMVYMSVILMYVETYVQLFYCFKL